MDIRPARSADHDAVWAILQPIIVAGETFAMPADWSREQALGYWFAPGHGVFVAEQDGAVLGSYYLRANQQGGGNHVANCGYMVSGEATGQGVARAMCGHSLDHARSLGFKAMQFNIVVATNVRAVKLWQGMGFAILATLPSAFRHSRLGYVDAYVMHQTL